MLSELKRLHADLLAHLDELERLTSEPVMRPEEVAAARLKLTRASRRRSMFLDSAVYPALIGNDAATDAERVRQLRSDDKRRFVTSASHIAKWTLQEIAAHWSEYCSASRSLRAAMRDRIREEQAVLYPLLRD